MSSEEDVTEDDKDRAGVELGVFPWALARASASETADRYEAAVLSTGVDFFLNIDGVGAADCIAIGEGMSVDARRNSRRVVVVRGEDEAHGDERGCRGGKDLDINEK